MSSLTHRNSSTESPNVEVDSVVIQIAKDERRSQIRNLRRDLFSAELSLNDQKYFTENFTEILDTTTNFNIKVFLEFTIYHIFFFMLLGPLTSFLIYLFYGDMKLAKNLGFWGLNVNLFLQIFVFIINFLGLFGYLYFNIQTIYPIEIVVLLGGCLCRSFVIAIKYALFPEKKLNYVKYTILTAEDVRSEFMLNWYSQTDYMIEKELYSSILRNNIDEDVFLFYFLRPLKPELRAILTQKTEYEEKFKGIDNPLDPEKMFGETDYYSGYAIARFLIKENRKYQISAKILLFICFLMSIIHALIPLLYRYFEKSTAFGIKDIEKFIMACIFIGNVYFYFFNFLFILFGVFEYERPIKLLSQLSNFLAAKKVEIYHIRKIFPTVNFFCAITFRSWFTMNKIFRDYGQKYLKRIDMHLVIFLLYYVIIVLVCIISIFELIPKFQQICYVMFGFEMLLVFSTVFYVIFKGVIINDLYVIHQSLLNEIKEIISDFIALDRLYFDIEGYTPKNEVYRIGKEMTENILFHFYGPKDHRTIREKRELYFKNLLGINEFVGNQLAFHRMNHPFKVLGIPANMATLQSLFAAIGTGITIAFNKLFNGN